MGQSGHFLVRIMDVIKDPWASTPINECRHDMFINTGLRLICAGCGASEARIDEIGQAELDWCEANKWDIGTIEIIEK